MGIHHALGELREDMACQSWCKRTPSEIPRLPNLVELLPREGLLHKGPTLL